MTLRVPPRTATWLLKRLGTPYRNESLAGDLFEEYQQHRTPAWYWRQTAAAIFLGRIRRIHITLSKFALTSVLRCLIELGIVLGGIALAQSKALCPATSRACHSHTVPAASTVPVTDPHTNRQPQ
jgi:hypothetical protein